MKLSDLLTALADNARTFEGQLTEWEKTLSARGDEMRANFRKWQEDAERQRKEMSAQFKGYAAGVDGDLKEQWDKLEDGFERQFEVARKQAAEWQAEAERNGAEAAAKWHEAYAAALVSMAKRAEREAGEAIAAAAEARAKAEGRKV